MLSIGIPTRRAVRERSRRRTLARWMGRADKPVLLTGGQTAQSQFVGETPIEELNQFEEAGDKGEVSV